MYIILEKQILARKAFTLEAERLVARFWRRNVDDAIQKKLPGREAYATALRAFFASKGAIPRGNAQPGPGEQPPQDTNTNGAG